MSAQTHIFTCTYKSHVCPSDCICGCHRGVLQAEHEITYAVKRRPCGLVPHRRAVCATDGPVSDWTDDLDDAKREGRQHVEQVAADALAAEVAG